MMKIIVFCLTVLFGNSITAQETTRIDSQNLVWNLDFDKAIELGKLEHKPILIYFTGSDWCSACELVYEEFFALKKFKPLLDKYILYEADFPKKKENQNAQLLAYNEKLKATFVIKHFPTTVIIDAKEKYLGEIMGYRRETTAIDYFNFLKEFVD
ncbi:thioredoxin family protein [Flavobacteriaceae bacterium F08102]|nr:thioredoxin family protein [Flavobacteriaceae bacterium F08102]